MSRTQGLDKMKLMYDLGYKQCIIPPQERPLLNDYDDYQNMAINASASSMWVANSSTVAPSADTKNNKLNLLTSNLILLIIVELKHLKLIIY